MKKQILLALLCTAALPGMALDPLFTSTVQPPTGCIDKNIATEELSLADLQQISICTNPSLSAQYMGVKATEANLGAGRSQYLPSVTLTGNAGINGYRVEEHGGYLQSEPYTGKAEASWLLFDFGGRENRVGALRAYADAANFGYNAALHDLLLSVQTAYLNLLAAQETLVSANASLDSYKQSYNEAQKRYKLGMVSLSDKLQAQTRYEQALLAVVLAEDEVKQFSGQLAVLLNLSPSTSLKLIKPNFDQQSTAIENDDVEQLMKDALANRPELRAQESTQRAVKSNLNAAKTDMLPTISAAASSTVNDSSWKHHSLYERNNTAGLMVSMPLFTGFSNFYKVKAASWLYQQEQANTQNLRLSIQNEVWRSYQNYKTAVRAYEISQTVLASAEENHRVAFRYYQVGKADILTLLDAVAQLADARQNKISAFYSLLLSKANLYKNIGK